MADVNTNNTSSKGLSDKMSDLKAKGAQKTKAQVKAQQKAQSRATQAAVDKAVSRAINNESLRPGRIPPGQWGFTQESSDGQLITRSAKVSENGSMQIESINERVTKMQTLSDSSTEAYVSRHVERYSIENTGWSVSEQIWSNERSVFRPDGTSSVQVLDTRRTLNKGFANTQDKAQATSQWNAIVEGASRAAEREI